MLRTIERLRSPEIRKEISVGLFWRLFANAIRIRLFEDPTLKPLIFTYYNTLRCNFGCSFCSFARSGVTEKGSDELNTEDSIRLLHIIRESCPRIYFSGGEPLVRRDLAVILAECERMRFGSITVNTNMSLIHQQMEILDYLDNLVASFHQVDDRERARVCQISKSMAQQVRENLIVCAGLQEEKDFMLTVNCVVTPESIRSVREVMEFCFKHNIWFEGVPVALEGGWPNPALMGNEDYQSLIEDIIEAKRKGRRIIGSFLYFDRIIDFTEFDCHPALTPYVAPDGKLFYACPPIGTIRANLFEYGSCEKALRALREEIRKHGGFPYGCGTRCFKVGNTETAEAMRHPLLWLRNL